MHVLPGRRKHVGNTAAQALKLTRQRGALLELLERRRLLSAPNVWHAVGIGGTGTDYYANVNPLRPSEMYLGSDMGEVWHTTDTGVTWQTLDQNNQLTSQAMASHVHYTSDVNTAYAMSGGQLKKTIDSGNVWTSVPGTLNTKLGFYGVHLDVDPSSTTRLIVSKCQGSTYGFYFSNDGGATYTPIVESTSSYKAWFAGSFWDGNNIYLATNQGLWTSADGGAHWAQSSLGGLGANEVYESFAGSKVGATTRFWAVTWTQAGFGSDPPALVNPKDYFGGIYTIDVGQANWTNKTSPFWNASPTLWMPRWVQMQDNNIGNIWVGGGDGGGVGAFYTLWPIVYKSTDTGANWTRLLKVGDSNRVPGELPNENIQTHSNGRNGDWDWGFGGPTVTFIVDRANPNIMTWTNAGDVFRTDDGGTSWRSIAADPADLNPAGAVTPQHRFYHSTLNETSIWNVTFMDAQTIFADSTDVTGIRSIDGGQSWQKPTYLGSLVNTNTFYDSVYDVRTGMLYGATSGAHDMYVSWVTDGLTESGGNDYVAMSSDKGATWDIVHSFGVSHSVKAIALDPNNPNVMYAGIVNHDGTIGGIYKTSDLQNGASSTWTRLANQPSRDLDANGTQDFAGMHAQQLFVLNDGTVVAVFAPRTDSTATLTPTSGIWVSTDGGATWQDRSGARPPTGTPFPADPNTVRDAGGIPLGTSPAWNQNLLLYGTMNITIDPNDPTQSTWFAVDQFYPPTVYGNGVIYKSTNRGQTWTAWSYVGNDYNSYLGAGNRVWIEPGGKQMYFASKSTGIYYCADYTVASPVFQHMSNLPFGQVLNITSNPWNPDQMWVTTFGNGMWYADLRELAPVPAVTNVSAQTLGPSEVRLSWTSTQPYASTYRIEKSLNGVSGWTPAGTSWSTAGSSYLVTGLTGGTRYYFRVISVNGAGDGPASMVASALTDSAAGVIASEGFGPSTGALNGTNGGTGWNGGWVAGSASVVSDNVIPVNPPTPIDGNARSVNVSGSDSATRQLAAPGGIPLVGTPGTVLWASFEEKSAGNGTLTFGTPTNGFGFGTPQYSNWPGFYTVIGGVVNEKNSLRNDQVAIDGTKAHFFAARFQFESDTVSFRMFADPIPGLLYPNADSEVSDWNVNFPNGQFPNMLSAGSSAITVRGPGSGTNSFDEIRIGGSYTDVAPKVGGSVPAAPSSITTTLKSKNRIDVTWTDGATTEEGFNLEYSSNGTTYTAIERIPGTLSGSGLTQTYSVTNLSPSSAYWFRVNAFNKVGTSSYRTTASSTTTLPAALSTAVSNLAVSVNNSQFQLTWSDVAGETGYLLQYTDNVATVFNDKEPIWTSTTLPANSTSYTYSSLPNNVTYFFRILPYNAGGNAPVSNIVSAASLGAPTGLTATGIADTQIGLTWVDSVSGETGFTIQKSTDGINWSPAGTAAANATTYVATGLSANTVYQFRVQAYAAVSTSPWSTIASGRTFSTSSGLTAYEGFNYYADPNSSTEMFGQNGGVGWSGAWGPPVNVELRGTKDVSSGGLTATNTTVANNLLSNGNSFDSTDFGAIGRSLATPISAANGTIMWAGVLVKNFTATPFGMVRLVDASGNDVLDFGYCSNNDYSMQIPGWYTWDLGSRPGANETHLLVLRITYGANPTPGDKIDLWLDPDPTLSNPGTPTWTRTSTGNNMPAVSQIQMIGSNYIGLNGVHEQWDELRLSYGANASYSAVVPVKLPGIPTTLAASVANPGIALSWTDAATNEQGFHIERSTDQINWSTVQTLAANLGGWTDTAVSAGTRYYYRVSSYNATGDSMPSNTANAVAPGTANVDGTSGNDVIRLVRNSPSNSIVDVFLNNNTQTPSWTYDFSSGAQMHINGLGGDDELIVDYSNGAPGPLAGFAYDGGAGSNKLRVIGSSGNDSATMTATNVTCAGIPIAYSNAQVSTIDLGGGADSLTVNGGSLAYSADAAAGTAALSLTVGPSGSINFAATQHLANLTINGAGSSVTVQSGGSTLIDISGALAISGGGKLNLGDNRLALQYTTDPPGDTWLSRITTWIQDGRNGGAWNGAGIMTSMPAAISPSNLATIGAAEASAALNLGASQTALWHGQPVDATTVLVSYTYAGDANLDGVINGDDFFNIDEGFAAQASGYLRGDFDYNGRIDADDYWLIDSNYNKAQAPPAPPVALARSVSTSGTSTFAGIFSDRRLSAYEQLIENSI